MPEAVSVDTFPIAGSIGNLKGPKGAVNGASATPAKAVPDIIDIRRSLVEMDLKADVLSMFNPSHGARQLPTMLLYNEKGLQLFEDVRSPPIPPYRGLELTPVLDHLLGGILPDEPRDRGPDAPRAGDGRGHPLGVHGD